MLKIKPFEVGTDEETYVAIYNATFWDYDDIRKMTLEEYRKIQKSPNYSAEGLLVAEWNDKAVGIVDAFVDKLRKERKGFIQSLGVLPEFRRRGIAKNLVNVAVENLRRRGMKAVDTSAQTDREGCLRIFESLGFRQIRATSLMKTSLKNIPSNIRENRQITIKTANIAKDEDVKLLNMLDNETFREHFNFRPRTLEETLYTLFEMPWYRLQKWFFAELDGKAVGYVGVAVDEDLNEEKNLKWGWIWDIGVLKPHRRKGVGARLMLHGMQTMKKMKMEDSMLYVDDMNPTKAIELYRKLGFNVFRRNIIYELKIA